MIYLLDANFLIDANRDYLSIERVPEFWDWLVFVGEQGLVKIPIEIYEEIREGNTKEDDPNRKIDLLAKWAKEDGVREALLLKEDVDESLVAQITNEGYADDLTDDELVKIGRDPFLVAYALIDPTERFVVTTEASKPSRKRANRHLPDVCRDFGVTPYHGVEFIRALDFKTSWNS